MNDPFAGLMFLVGGICMLPVIYKLKLNLYRSGQFNNASFQAGMIMASTTFMIGLGLISLIFWSLT